MVKYRLEWTVDGVRHHSEYKSQAIAEACFEECSSIKSHTDVTLLEIAPKVLRKSEDVPGSASSQLSIESLMDARSMSRCELKWTITKSLRLQSYLNFSNALMTNAYSQLLSTLSRLYQDSLDVNR